MTPPPVPLVFGSLRIWPEERKLLVEGVSHRPGARAFDLLLLLVENRDRVVSKAEIFERIWSGLVVEENNLTVQISALRKILGPDVLATFSGRGYRFMPAFAGNDAPAAEPPDALRLPDKPSIAVLPFLHLASDSKREYFTDGITEDITTELSRFRALFVISRQSSFTYKGRAVDVRTVARELGVRYVVEGSVRITARKLRVTAQLIDASSGEHVWAEKYDGDIEELFNIQDDMVGRISVALMRGVESHEFHSLRQRPGDWGAYEIAVQAYQLASDAYVRSDQVLRGRALVRAQEALSLDPNSMPALRAKVHVLWQTLFFSTAHDRAGTLKEAFEALDHLEALDASNSKVYTYRGLLLHEAGQDERALDVLRKAHQLNPNDVGALSGLGMLELFTDKPAEAAEHLLQACRLSPLDPWAWQPNTLLANAYIGLKDYRQALYFSRLGVSQAPHIVTPHSAVAAACVGLGQLAQAAQAMTQAVRVGSEFLHKRLLLLESGHPLNESTRSRLHLTLTAMRLVDRTLMSEPLRELLGRLDGLQVPHPGP
ncbi:MAG TPA: winged helix-turn-helix domain-containing protein [Ramlibacter sp.]|nr:winged helix-turn-helix domain-containing protein [Ramlibacter sp.]